MPQMGVSVAEGTVVAWRVGVGDRIEAEQAICEISTDKIDTEVPAPASGVVAEILVEVDETVEVGTVMARIAVEGGGGGPAAAAPDVAADGGRAGRRGAGGHRPARRAGPRPARETPGRRYSPVVARIAAEHAIDLSTVEGTGRGGRVRKQDVLAVVNGNGQRRRRGRGTAAAHREPVPARPAAARRPPRPQPAGRSRPAAACRACAARSASA